MIGVAGFGLPAGVGVRSYFTPLFTPPYLPYPGLHMRKYRPPYLPYSGPQIPETQKARISDGPGSDRIFGSIPPTDHLDLRQSVGGRGEASIDGRGSRLGGGVR